MLRKKLNHQQNNDGSNESNNEQKDQGNQQRLKKQYHKKKEHQNKIEKDVLEKDNQKEKKMNNQENNGNLQNQLDTQQEGLSQSDIQKDRTQEKKKIKNFQSNQQQKTKPQPKNVEQANQTKNSQQINQTQKNINTNNKIKDYQTKNHEMKSNQYSNNQGKPNQNKNQNPNYHQSRQNNREMKQPHQMNYPIQESEQLMLNSQQNDEPQQQQQQQFGSFQQQQLGSFQQQQQKNQYHKKQLKSQPQNNQFQNNILPSQVQDSKKNTNNQENNHSFQDQKKKKYSQEKQSQDKKEFSYVFCQQYLGLKLEKRENERLIDLEKLTNYKLVGFKTKSFFNQEIQKALKYIKNWVKANQTMIERSNFNEESFQNIKIFTTCLVDLKNKFDQILNKNFEKLLNNQQLEDLDKINGLLDILNKKQKQEEFEDQNELQMLNDFSNLVNNKSRNELIDSNSKIASQQTLDYSSQQDNNSDAQSFISDLTDNSINSEKLKLTKEQKEEFKIFSLKLFKRFQECLKLEYEMNKRNLPAYYARQEMQNLLEVSNPFILLMGSTGSGKTTQTPQVLYQHQLMDDKKFNKVIYCVQPRKINCLSISERVANEMGCKLGEKVGYQVGYSLNEKKFNNFTKIIFITETILMNMLVKQNKQKGKQNKKSLSSYCSYIILDEVHERSIKSDIIMGLAKTILSQQNDLKFILSSATVDQNMYFSYFQQLKMIEIPGKIHPVDEEFITEEGSSVDKVIKHLNLVLDRIEQGVELHNGHVLVFMIDGQEIDQCIKQATNLPKLNLDKYVLLPLHSLVEKEKQELVFKEHFNKERQQMKKIIFSTNIAETAVTINNVTIIIDCGMEKVAKFDPRKNITSIQSNFISKSSAKQRQGRAGRTCPGICYKLYSEDEYESFPNEKVPEISRVNIEQVLLQIIESGENVETFPYFEQPDPSILKCSKENLIRIGGIDVENNSLTEIGKIMQKSDLEPYQVKCIIDAYRLNVIDQVINILAVMPEIGGLFKRYGEKKKSLLVKFIILKMTTKVIFLIIVTFMNKFMKNATQENRKIS